MNQSGGPMSDKNMEFLKASGHHLQTWNLVWKMIVISAVGVAALLLILFGAFVY